MKAMRDNVSVNEGAKREAFPSKETRFRQMLQSPELEFIMEAHNGLSAKIAEEAGFKGIWASGLSISAALGVRDNNEASWTQLLEVLEFMSDATTVPIMLDGDTGYGNFNNMRRLVSKLCQRRVAAVCIEDKLFPKSNSFIGEGQPLANIEEFCGKIKAGKDSQLVDDFSIVARVEALIAGWGLHEALRRAVAYHEAGADAILVHSKKHHPDEVLSFMKDWDGRCPVVIVPTVYYATPTERFREAEISLVIWANHNLRAAVSAMRDTSRRIYASQNLLDVEDRIARVEEIFALQGINELETAERRYLPISQQGVRAIVLAASRGSQLGDLTLEKPKCMVDVRGQPLLHRLVDTLNTSGIRDVIVVRGYKKEAVNIVGISTVDNDAYRTTGEVSSLACAEADLVGECVIAYGDILFRRFILDELLASETDITLVVNTRGGRDSSNPDDLVTCTHRHDADFLDEPEATELVAIGGDVESQRADGEWIGLMRVTEQGSKLVRDQIAEMRADGSLATADLPELLSRLLSKGVRIGVTYIAGHWLDVDDLHDLAEVRNFL